MPCDVRRYLVPFHPKRIPHHFADVLIIGGGIAGLRAAMQIDPQLSLLVITKDTMEQSNSAYAQGGIASVIDPDDNFASHVEDTLIAGANLCDRDRTGKPPYGNHISRSPTIGSAGPSTIPESNEPSAPGAIHAVRDGRCQWMPSALHAS